MTDSKEEKCAVHDLDEALSEGPQLVPQYSDLVKLRDRRQDKVNSV